MFSIEVYNSHDHDANEPRLQVVYIFSGRKVAVVAYLDCIGELVSIIFIVFIGNTPLPGASAF